MIQRLYLKVSKWRNDVGVEALPHQKSESGLEPVSTTYGSGWVRSPQAARCYQRKVYAGLI